MGDVLGVGGGGGREASVRQGGDAGLLAVLGLFSGVVHSLLLLEDATVPVGAALRRTATLQALRDPARAATGDCLKYSDLLPSASTP